MVSAPMPGPKQRGQRGRRLSPSTSWVAFSARANVEQRARARRRRRPGGRCRRGSRPGARCAASAPGLAPVSPSERATWTASRSPPLDRAAIRAARRISVSPSGPPVRATTTRSRASQVPVDVVLLAVLLQRVVDPVGGPEQRQLAQRGEVADPEVVGEGGVDLLGRVDVAVGHPAAQRLGGHVDQLDLVGRADHRVGHRLALRHAGDLLDDVVDRLEVLDVDRGDDVDAGGEQLLDVLPALRVARAGHVGVGELVDQRDLGPAGEHGVDVHLGERRRRGRSSSCARDHLQAVEHLGGVLRGRGSRRTRRRRRCRARARRWPSPSMA